MKRHSVKMQKARNNDLYMKIWNEIVERVFIDLA